MIELPLSENELEALAAIKQAHAAPRHLTASEAQEFLAFRRQARLTRIESICLSRRGRLVFRERGARGADLPCPPFEWRYRQSLLAYQRLLGRLARRPPTDLAVAARRTNAELRAARVLAIYPDYANRGRAAAALIAKKLNERQAYVRRILRENVHDRKS